MRGTFCVQLPAQPRASKGTLSYHLPKIRDVLAYSRTSEIALKEAPLHTNILKLNAKRQQKMLMKEAASCCVLVLPRTKNFELTVPKTRKSTPIHLFPISRKTGKREKARRMTMRRLIEREDALKGRVNGAKLKNHSAEGHLLNHPTEKRKQKPAANAGV